MSLKSLICLMSLLMLHFSHAVEDAQNAQHRIDEAVDEMAEASSIGEAASLAPTSRSAITPVFPIGVVYPLWFNRFTSQQANSLPSADSMVRQSSTTAAVCQTTDGISGTCTSASTCKSIGGTPFTTNPQSLCPTASMPVCCANVASGCIATASKNNTHWQSPSSIPSASHYCMGTVQLPATTSTQPKICQLKLEFVTFSVAQPNSESVCNVDSFSVAGNSVNYDNNPPVICGNNDGQHMYINVDPTITSDVILVFNFGTLPKNQQVTRSWNIRVQLLPCGASYLAPANCLQYFASGTPMGTIKSFNWKDVAAPTAAGAIIPTRQLANQNYQICIKTEIAKQARATQICYSACKEAKTTLPFSLSGNDLSQANVVDCNNDFLLIPEGFDPTLPDTSVATNTWDRFCGEELNPLQNAITSTTVCTQISPFVVFYNTNSDETLTDTKDAAGFGNVGFCLDYAQS